MNVLWFRLLRSIYRKEPITGFVITVGAVNVAIGSIDQSSSLVFFGLGTVAIALLLRWWQGQQRPAPKVVEPPRAPRALPPYASRPSLPDLSLPKKPYS